jgi:hypothetical protein
MRRRHCASFAAIALLTASGCGGSGSSSGASLSPQVSLSSTTFATTTTPGATSTTRGPTSNARSYQFHAETADGYILDSTANVSGPVPLATSDVPITEQSDPSCIGADQNALVTRVDLSVTMTKGLATTVNFQVDTGETRTFETTYSTGPTCISQGNTANTGWAWQSPGTGGSTHVTAWFVFPGLLTPNCPSGDPSKVVSGDGFATLSFAAGTESATRT